MGGPCGVCGSGSVSRGMSGTELGSAERVGATSRRGAMCLFYFILFYIIILCLFVFVLFCVCVSVFVVLTLINKSFPQSSFWTAWRPQPGFLTA